MRRQMTTHWTNHPGELRVRGGVACDMFHSPHLLFEKSVVRWFTLEIFSLRIRLLLRQLPELAPEAAAAVFDDATTCRPFRMRMRSNSLESSIRQMTASKPPSAARTGETLTARNRLSPDGV